MKELNNKVIYRNDGVSALMIFIGFLPMIPFSTKRLKWRTVDGMEVLTLSEISEQIKRLKQKCGTITVWIESPLSGEIFLYGNYGDFWTKHGTTQGYA